jgi:hypothetical protein
MNRSQKKPERRRHAGVVYAINRLVNQSQILGDDENNGGNNC